MVRGKPGNVIPLLNAQAVLTGHAQTILVFIPATALLHQTPVMPMERFAAVTPV